MTLFFLCASLLLWYLPINHPFTENMISTEFTKQNILTGFPFCSPWCRESQSQQAGRPWGCNPARHAESRRSIQERRAAASRSWAAENTAARTRRTSSAAFHHCPSESFLEKQTKTCRRQTKRESPKTAIKKIISFTVQANSHDHKTIIKIKTQTLKYKCYQVIQMQFQEINNLNSIKRL